VELQFIDFELGSRLMMLERGSAADDRGVSLRDQGIDHSTVVFFDLHTIDVQGAFAALPAENDVMPFVCRLPVLRMLRGVLNGFAVSGGLFVIKFRDGY